MISNLFEGFLHILPTSSVEWICSNIKHVVLNAAHPLPEKIEVYPGEEETLEYSILMELLTYVQAATCIESDETATPYIKLNGVFVASGWQAIVRYLATINHGMPTNPETALVVNMFLAITGAMIDHPPVTQEELALALSPFEDALRSDGGQIPEYLGHLDAASVADTVARQTIERCVLDLPGEFDWSNLTLTCDWYTSRVRTKESRGQSAASDGEG